MKVAPNGDVLDALGRQLVRSGFYDNAPAVTLARNTLLALANNAAAGLHTPEPGKAAEEPPTRAEFVRDVAGCLYDDLEVGEDTAIRMAESGLAAFLLEAGLKFGAAEQAWDFDAAMDLAARIRTEGLGQADPADEEAA
ncbi:MAG: hypothetical protein LPK04_01650 [Caulobacteraceae bacterium]|nr:hypothetical protein [Caulobacteraceae bacterium]